MDDLGRYPKGRSGRDPFELSCTEPATGLRLVELNQPWGHGAPIWPGDSDVRVERGVTHARDGVFSQKITATMHVSTHLNAPIHLIQGGADVASLPIDRFFRNGCVLGIPKKRWELVTADDLANATPAVQPGDIVVVNTGWHRKYSDSQQYFGCAPGMSKEAAEWLVAKNISLFGIDTAAVDHPLATSLGAHRNGPLMSRLPKYYLDQTGRNPKIDFPEWNPAHRALLAANIPTIENVGGALDDVTGLRCTFQVYPWKFRDGDACVVRFVAIFDPSGRYRIASGE
jgi:kynurenine formamidase